MRAAFRLWPSGVLIVATLLGILFVSHDTNLLGRGAGEDVPAEDESSAEAHAALVMAILADDEEIAPVSGPSRSPIAPVPTSSASVTATRSPVSAVVTPLPPPQTKATPTRRARIRARGAKMRGQGIQARATGKAGQRAKSKRARNQRPTKKSQKRPTIGTGAGTVAPTVGARDTTVLAGSTPPPGSSVALLTGGISGGVSVINTPAPVPAVVARPSTATVDLATRTLRIHATDTPSTTTVALVYTGSGFLRVGNYVVTSSTDGAIGRFTMGEVARIEFIGGTASDTFSADGLGIPVTALGNDGDDTIVGGSGRNSLDGGNGNDTLRAIGPGSFYGQSGNDRITAGDGVDIIDGGDDNDTIDAGGGNDQIDGGPGNDTIYGGADNDTITGYIGIDGIYGGTGDDSIDGGPGTDGIDGGPGVDTLRGGEESDVIQGRAGDDSIEGGPGDDVLLGGSEIDTIRGGPGRDTIDGEPGDDAIFGDSEDDNIQGGMGRDTIEGGDGADTLRGGVDPDLIKGQNGNDTIFGDDGDDKLFGNAGFDTIEGGAGQDVINGGSETDTLSGGDHDDWLVAIDDENFDSLRGGPGRDNFWRDVGVNNSDINLDLGAPDADHGVRQFANAGADKTLNGDAIPGPAYPAELGTASFANNRLFSSDGPLGTDITQGEVSDCKVITALSAMAINTSPASNWAIRRAIVDLGDGTYGFHLGDKFYRVDSILPLKQGDPSMPQYANLGPQGSVWVALTEKAIALANPNTPGAPNYQSLSSLGVDTVFGLFGSANRGTPTFRSYGTSLALGADVAQRLSGPTPQYLTVSLSAENNFALQVRFISNHAYTVWALTYDSRGNVDGVILRNPWGTDTGSTGLRTSDDNPNDGLVQMFFADLIFSGGRLNWGTRVP